MSKPVVFVSYSHRDHKDMADVVRHLSVLSNDFKSEGWPDEVWRDTQIPAGANWEEMIYEAIDSTPVAVLLITANFLNSEFIKNKELPRLLERKRRGEIKIIPLIMRHCAWDEVEWLKVLQVRPKDGVPVWGSGNTIDHTLADFAKEVGQIIKQSGSAATPERFRAQPARQTRKYIWYGLAFFVLFFVGSFYLRNMSRQQLSKEWQIGPAKGTILFPKYISPGEQEMFQLNGFNQLDKDIPVGFELISSDPIKLDIGQGNNYFCNGWAQKKDVFKHQLAVSFPLGAITEQALFNQPIELSLWGHAGNAAHQKLTDLAMFIAPIPYISRVIIILCTISVGLFVFIATAMWKQMKS